MSQNRRRILFGLTLAASAMLLALVVISQGLMGGDTRVHALGITLIFHKTGEIALRLPSGRLMICSLFESDNAPILPMACFGLLIVVMLMKSLLGTKTPHQKEPRGFPLD